MGKIDGLSATPEFIPEEHRDEFLERWDRLTGLAIGIAEGDEELDDETRSRIERLRSTFAEHSTDPKDYEGPNFQLLAAVVVDLERDRDGSFMGLIHYHPELGPISIKYLASWSEPVDPVAIS